MSQKTMFRKKESAGPLEKFDLVKCTCCDKLVPGKVIYWPGMSPETKPLWKPCKECGVWLSHLEEDNKSLKGRCVDCSEQKF